MSNEKPSSTNYLGSTTSSSGDAQSGGKLSTLPIYRATMRAYTIDGKTYQPTQVDVEGDTFSGVASWYGKDFHGKKTSNGEIYNMHDMTAAHKTFPMNTMLKVTNLKNNKSVPGGYIHS